MSSWMSKTYKICVSDIEILLEGRIFTVVEQVAQVSRSDIVRVEILHLMHRVLRAQSTREFPSDWLHC